MNMEIERKFLPNGEIPCLDNLKRLEIAQAYISTSPIIRIRKSNDDYYLTIKSLGHIVKEEYEIAITSHQYENLLQKSETIILEKTRYLMPLEANLTAEIDLYHGELDGLITVEVEFSSLEEAEAFSPPLWFGRDVSELDVYKNSYLVKYGLPKTL